LPRRKGIASGGRGPFFIACYRPACRRKARGDNQNHGGVLVELTRRLRANCERSLGIPRAQALTVHLANHKLTKSRRGRWIASVAALTVSLTVCDASCPELSNSLATLSPLLQSFQMKRPEQKAPYDLNILRVCEDSVVRLQMRCPSTSTFISIPPAFYGSVGPIPRLSDPFPRQPHPAEIPRAPPLMDPPLLS
jgi:hypothetical protein